MTRAFHFVIGVAVFVYCAVRVARVLREEPDAD